MIGTRGDAGAIVITTPRLEVTGGARIDSTTATNGRGGNVSITADQVSFSGERPTDPVEPAFNLGSRRGSGIFTGTVGSEFCTGPCGNAGTISINTGSLAVEQGAQINSGTTNTGRGGDVGINTRETMVISGTRVTAPPVESSAAQSGRNRAPGEGGNIALTAGQSVNLANGSTISASSAGRRTPATSRSTKASPVLPVRC